MRPWRWMETSSHWGPMAWTWAMTIGIILFWHVYNHFWPWCPNIEYIKSFLYINNVISKVINHDTQNQAKSKIIKNHQKCSMIVPIPWYLSHEHYLNCSWFPALSQHSRIVRLPRNSGSVTTCGAHYKLTPGFAPRKSMCRQSNRTLNEHSNLGPSAALKFWGDCPAAPVVQY